jgi:hypothetical protein
MTKKRGRNIFTGTAITLALLSMALWSWNVLAGITGAPEAEFRHIIAVTILFALLRWTLFPGAHSELMRPRHREQ